MLILLLTGSPYNFLTENSGDDEAKRKQTSYSFGPHDNYPHSRYKRHVEDSELYPYFKCTLTELAVGGPIAVACSGGPDSMALTLLAHQWAREHGVSLLALIVDHGLRATSADEARQTQQWLQQRHIPSEILSLSLLTGSRLQERARHARYDALLNACRRHAIPFLLLGHHADDQAETVLFRLARGSGLNGLCGMAVKQQRQGIELLRPLLSVSKAVLLRYCELQHQPWILDPSNSHPAFARTSLRHILANTASLNASERLWRVSHAMGQFRAAEEARLLEWVKIHVTLSAYGTARLASPFGDLHALDQTEILSRLLQCVDGSTDIPRTDDINRLLRRMPLRQTQSLHRCLIMPQTEGWLICREPAETQAAVPLEHGLQWDRRFIVDYHGDDGYHIAALGESGRRHVKDHLRLNLPLPVQQSLPTLWRLDAVACVPHMGYYSNDWGNQPITIRFAPAKALADAPFYAMNKHSDYIR